MRPSHSESIRGIQAALMEEVAPEIRSVFGLNVMQTIQMLLESLASSSDTEAENLHRDNGTIVGLLSQSANVLRGLPQSNDLLNSVVYGIESAVNGPAGESFAISALSARNNELRAILERTLVIFEEKIDDPDCAGLLPPRQAIYNHLREVAARGWSFWDAASFRERMARERSA